MKKEGTLWLNLGDSYTVSQQGGSKSKPGDKSYTNKIPKGYKQKDLIGIPWRVAFALQADGWYLRQDIIWAKPNPMPESVTDRCTKSHEYIFLLSKSPKYFFDNEAIKEPSITNENRPGGVVRDREYGYDSKQAVIQKRVRPNGISVEQAKKLGNVGNCGVNETRNRRSVWTIATKPYKDAHFATFPQELIIPMIKAGCPEKGLVLDPFMGSGTTAYVARTLGRNYLGIELNSQYIKLAEKRLSQQQLL